MAKRDFTKFDAGTNLSELQEEFLAKRQALIEPPPLDKATEMFIKAVVSRHGWVRSRLRTQVLQQARLSRGKYQCKMCMGVFGPGEVEVDHMFSRVQPSGPNTLTDYLRRTFPPAEYLACLCKQCHRVCTNGDHYNK